jgi:hypothetical protein
VKLINTDGMAFIGPGSEWFWTALSGIVLAVTFIAIYRQLRLQRSQSAMDQLDRFHREWTSERMLRHQLGAWVARRDLADPAAVPFAAGYALANFWEKVGALAKGGHADPKLLWDLFGNEIGECWTLLAPQVKASQAKNLDPSLFEHFEWLASAVTRFVPAAASVLDQDHVQEAAPSRIASLLGLIDVEQSVRTVMIASPQAMTPAPSAAAAPATG